MEGAPCRGCPGGFAIPQDDGLEPLRLEYLLPVATRQAGAEKVMWSALKKVSHEMQLPMPLGPQMVRQVVVLHGSVLTLLAVPKRAWQWSG